MTNTPPAGLLLLTVLVAAPAVAADEALAPGGPRCDRARLATELGIDPRRWFLACLALDQDRWAVAAVPLPDLAVAARKTAPLPFAVRVAVAQGAKIRWREEVALGEAAAPAAVREVVDRADDWIVAVDRQTLGGGAGLRVGVMGQWGGRERFMVREIALIYQLPDEGPPRRVWSGAGSARESRYDHCIVESIASFRMVDEATLERQLQVKAKLEGNGRGVPRAAARKLRKECVAKDAPAERFSVAR